MKKLSDVPFDKIYVGMQLFCPPLEGETKKNIMRGIVKFIDERKIGILFDRDKTTFFIVRMICL